MYAPDQWEPSVAYNTLSVRSRKAKESMDQSHTNLVMTDEDQLTTAELNERLHAAQGRLIGDPEWQAIEAAVAADPAVRRVDKIVFFYAWGLSDDCDICKRAMFLLSAATRLRDALTRLREGDGACTAGAVNHELPTGLPLPAASKTGELRKERMRARVKMTAARAEADAVDSVPGGPIPIFVPAFDLTRIWNAEETAMLTRAGVTPIDSNGELFLKIDERTAVISYRHWNPVKQVVADMARPAIMICKPVAKNPDDFRWREETRNGVTVKIP